MRLCWSLHSLVYQSSLAPRGPGGHRGGIPAPTSAALWANVPRQPAREVTPMGPDVCRSVTGDLASYPRYRDKITAVEGYGRVAIPRLRSAPQADLPVRHLGDAGMNPPVM